MRHMHEQINIWWYSTSDSSALNQYGEILYWRKLWFGNTVGKIIIFINKCYALLLISAGQKIPGVYTRPITRAQKLENLQLCMSFMGNRNINLQGIYVGGK